jgi:RNA polymerase sigma-70 factor (ECF subfamily)
MRFDSVQMTSAVGAAIQPFDFDEDLIRRTLAGDREAFGELALRYEAPLFGHLRRLLRNREDAEELAQEALLRAYRSLGSCHNRRAFGPWLFRIGTNLALDVLRRRGHLTFEGAELLDQIPDRRAATIAEKLDAARARQQLESALQQLPPYLNAIVNCFYREEMKLGQIAAIFQRDRRTIAVALHRARQKLRMILTLPGGGNDQ